ncbi:unnamed protein product [Adineta steineri]|nr:unnamed protein product [Adineta steineri]CAF1365309.1 unnamed protein product [Adineta steineri]
MSAGIMPDMYRHTARKSTVSKTIKSSNIPLCNTSTLHYSSYNNNDIDSKQDKTTIFDTIQCNIKFEEEIPRQQEPFIILRDNEIEQMTIEENLEQTDENIIDDIIQQIINQIPQSSILLTSNQIPRTFSIDTQDVHNALNSIMNHCDENDHTEFLCPTENIQIEENVNKNLNEIIPMECEQTTSIISRSQTDDDIVEIEASRDNQHSDSCTCQCHKPISSLNEEYLLFEQALKQTRLEQQQERVLNNNRLIQTLKRQHEELINIYQQNKNQKLVNVTKIDREQQTLKLNSHDSQIQTDFITINNSKISLQQQQQQKSIVIPTTNNNGPQTATRTPNTFFNSVQTTTTNSTLTQLIPRLTTNAIATTTTVTNKKSTVTTKTTTPINSSPTTPTLPPTPISATTSTSHDIVDLTEEEDEDDIDNRIATQRTIPIRQTTSSSSLPTSSSSLPTSSSVTATTTATRIRQANRPIRLNNTPANGQTFPLRPLPEHTPCDHTIARPQLSITQENATVRLTWNLLLTPMESIQKYEIYAYKQNATVTTSDWKKIGTVKSMRLPMAVTLKEFQSNSHYAFAVRAISTNDNIGPFCEPKTIFTGNTPVQPLHTSQLLNVST